MEHVVPLNALSHDDPFFLYQYAVNTPEEIVATHDIIQQRIHCEGSDYRYETAENPVEELRDRNATILLWDAFLTRRLRSTVSAARRRITAAVISRKTAASDSLPDTVQRKMF